MNDQQASEYETLERLSQAWIGKGFQVLLQPRKNSVPDFLHSYRPDAILTKDGEKIIVEVVRKGQAHTEEKIERLKSLIEGHKGWRLEVVYSGEEVESLERVQRQSIIDTVSSAEKLSVAEPRASLLLMWAALEATARNLFPNQTHRPQTPGRVIELLAGSGEVTPSEARILRNLMQLRNRVIHGELEAEVKQSDLQDMNQIARQLVERVKA